MGTPNMSVFLVASVETKKNTQTKGHLSRVRPIASSVAQGDRSSYKAARYAVDAASESRVANGAWHFPTTTTHVRQGLFAPIVKDTSFLELFCI